MATLHMETDIARSTQSNILNTHGQLTGMLQSMTGAVNNLQPSWLGNSATEFYATYDQWRGQMTGLLEQLNTLGARLQNEIAEWEAMSSKLA